MTTYVQEPVYVWRRNTERQPSGWVWWVIAAIAVLCGFGAFAAYMAEDTGQIPTFIGLGVMGSVGFWLIPRVYHWGRTRNPDIVMEGREMVWAKVRVPIDHVERWSASIERMYHYNGTTGSQTSVGFVRFHLMDGEQRAFRFTHLENAELDDLIMKIDPILPGRRIE